jgi:hypothetical protein
MPGTYQELKDSVLAFANNQVIEQNIDTFIDLNEADMSRRVRHWRMEKRSNANLDTQYTILPSDFLSPIRLSITSNDTYTLDAASVQDLASQRQRSANTTGRPRLYSIFDSSIEVWPSPDAGYTLEMVYYGRVSALSSSSTSNWILTYFPDAYLYGTLLHAAPFLGEDNRLPIWTQLYDKAVSGINLDNENAKFGGDGLKMQVRSY